MHQDHLSGTSLMTSANGSSLGMMKYYPYGSTRSGDVLTDIQFTGQRYDDTGLYYYNARYYDPEIGRFISPDTIIPNPSDPQSFNRYTYCLNNPLKYVDPSGNIVIIHGFDVQELDYYLNNPDAYTSAIANNQQLAEALSTALDSDEYKAHQVVREQDSEWASKLEQSTIIFEVGLQEDQTVEYKSESTTYNKNIQPVVVEPLTRNSNWYLDFNGQVGYVIGLTGGIMTNENETYFYLGFGLVPAPSASITYCGNQGPVEGWSHGAQGAYPVAYQVGNALGDLKGPVGPSFQEIGLGFPGVSYTLFYVWKAPND